MTAPFCMMSIVKQLRMCPKEINTKANCELVEQERDILKAAVLRSENWSVSKDIFINKYCKNFKKFTDSLSLDKL